MPEIGPNYIRLPVSRGHSKHRLRTITISDAKGIKAIYCGICKEIATYLFDKKRWTMKTAKAWVKKHKGGKGMGLDAVLIDDKEVLVEDLIKAYEETTKAKSEREKLRDAAQARAKKYGIAVKEAGNLTPPKGYPTAESEYGDPANFKYPADADHAKPALTYFNHEDQREAGDYSSKEWGIIGKRLAKLISRHLDGTYEYSKSKLQKKGEKRALELDELNEDKSLSLGERISAVRRAFEQISRPPKMPVTEAASDYWYIASDDIFDDYVIAKLGEKDAYKVPYTMDKDDNVEFVAQDKWEKVEREWVPSKAMNYCIKRLGETDDGWYIGGYGMIWGSGEQRDLSPWPNADGSKGEFFTTQTQGLDDLPVKVITFEHDKEKGPDGEPFRHVLGTTVLERDDIVGRWIEALVEKRRKYAGYVVDLIDQRVLNFSSETASHWREVAEDGEIKMWRTAGYTTTTHPMEPRLTDVNRLKAYYKSLDLDLAEPDMGGAGEEPGLEAEKAIAEIELLLLDIDMEEKT